MKRLSILLLFLPGILLAQPYHWDAEVIPTGAKGIEMPVMKHVYSFSRDEYIITNDSDYVSFFHDSVIPRLPKIDFTRYELLTTAYCMQCATVCRGSTSCHRNACRYTRRWFLSDKHNRIAVFADTLNLGRCDYFATYTNGDVCESDSCFAKLKKGCKELNDSMVDFSKQTVLSRHMDMDCAAQVEQDLYLDTANHVLVWRVSVGYGGCHGMQQRSLILAVPKLPDGYTVQFETYDLWREW